MQLDFEFSRDTEALVFRNPAADGRSSSKFVAVIDARGERAARAWFAERHEPGHLLCKDPSTELYRRTPSRRADPIEQVVDGVAAAIGFWKPIVEPVLVQELKRHSIFDAFDATRKQLAPQASVEASYRAFVRLCDFPLLLLRSSYATRKHDRTGSSCALRATTIIHNTGASKAGLHIPHNFRIPEGSIIHAAHSRRLLGTSRGVDDLGRWQDSKGTSLASYRVNVLARGAWAALVPV